MSGGGWLVVAAGFWLGVGALWLAGAGLGALWAARRPALMDAEPGAREPLLVLWSAAPWVSAGAVLGVVFLPSVLDWLGLVTDHCHEHGAGVAHLCFHHASGVLPGWGTVLLAAAATASLWAASRVRGRVGDSLEAGRGLDPWGRGEEGVTWLETDQVLAVTAGLLRPRSYLSRRLREELGPDHLRAVLAHEGAHRRRRDGARKLLIHGLTWAFPTGVGRALREAYDQTCEERCDRAAARAVGSAETVVRALLAVGRLSPSARTSPAAAGFQGGRLRRRIQVLLEPRWGPAPFGPTLALVFGPALALMAAAHEMHHLFEAGFGFLV